MQKQGKQSERFDLEKLIYFGKVAQQTERYDDQIKYLTECLTHTNEIKFDDLNLYANGYKCKINSIRTAWRAVSALQCKQTNSKSRSAAIIQFYKEKLQKQIRELCQQIICLVNSLSLRQTKEEKGKQSKDKNGPSQSEEKVKFLIWKIKGDYHRYLCEIAKDDEYTFCFLYRLKRFQKQCENAYVKGLKAINESSIKQQMKIDALKLGISLNLSVFYYEIMNNTQKAIEVSESAFNECLEAVSDIEDNRFTDLVTIMQLVHDNLTSWKGEGK